MVVEKAIVVVSQGGDGVLRFGKKDLRRVPLLNVTIKENFEL